jgi:hypothetical protein
MQPYLHAGPASGVTDYEIGTDYILVRFRGGRTYRYSHARAGVHHVERMKELARAGRGLATYISQHVQDLYDRDG